MATQALDRWSAANLERCRARNRRKRIGAAPEILPPKNFRTLAEYQVQGAFFNPTELKIEPGLSESEWAELGRLLANIGQSAFWWVGDFIQYGFDTYGKKRTYDLAQQATGWERHVLYDCSFVAKRFSPERRHARLSFFHHRMVATFPPAVADKLLGEAEEIGLTARQIRVIGQEESGKKECRYDREKVMMYLWRETYDRCKELANGKRLEWFLAQIIEEWLRGQAGYKPGRTQEEEREARVAAGLCVDCGERPASKDAGGNLLTRCVKCREYQSKWAKKNRKHTAALAAVGEVGHE